jgi:hypothetical protein
MARVPDEDSVSARRSNPFPIFDRYLRFVALERPQATEDESEGTPTMSRRAASWSAAALSIVFALLLGAVLLQPALGEEDDNDTAGSGDIVVAGDRDWDDDEHEDDEHEDDHDEDEEDDDDD